MGRFYFCSIHIILLPCISHNISCGFVYQSCLGLNPNVSKKHETSSRYLCFKPTDLFFIISFSLLFSLCAMKCSETEERKLNQSQLFFRLFVSGEGPKLQP